MNFCSVTRRSRLRFSYCLERVLSSLLSIECAGGEKEGGRRYAQLGEDLQRGPGQHLGGGGRWESECGQAMEEAVKNYENEALHYVRTEE